jgi:hypothetical protein
MDGHGARWGTKPPQRPNLQAVDTLPKLGRHNTGFVSVEIFSAIVFDNLKVLMKGAAGTYASLRAFRDDVDGTWRRDLWPVVKLGGNGLNAIIDEACRFATQCARAAEPVVFAPPLSTFSSNSKADTAHLANGLARISHTAVSFHRWWSNKRLSGGRERRL